MATVWNPGTWKPQTPTVRLRPQMQMSPANQLGWPKGRVLPGGFWEASFGDILLKSAAQIRAWRAFVAEADGGAGEFEVRLAEKWRQPWPVNAAGVQVYTPGGIAVTVTSAAALNATTLDVTKTSGSALEGGQHFSLTGSRWGKRLYRIKTATFLSGNNWRLEIRTGLREAFAAAAAVDFETPGFLATVANPDEIEPTLALMKTGSVDVTFQESFSR